MQSQYINFTQHNHQAHVPQLGLGVYQIPAGGSCLQVVQKALECGYRHIDTASLYGNEEDVGKALKQSAIKRSEVFITTKLWLNDFGYRRALHAFERSQNKLGVDVIDLYLIHAPPPRSQQEPTWKALEEIFLQGKAKFIGVSNYGVHHLKEMLNYATIAPVTNQVEVHPLLTREELVRFCKQNQIHITAYSPLAKGNFLHHPTLIKLAQLYDKTPAQIMLRWSIEKGFIAIPKTIHLQRLIENISIFDFQLSLVHIQMLDELNQYQVTGWDPTQWNK